MTQDKETKRCSQSQVTLSVLMGPQDVNRLGNVHGGVIMKLVDEAGALAAMRHAQSSVVTVVIDSMTFMEPVYVGNLLVCKAEVTYVGNTSMETRVEVTAEDPMTGEAKITNKAYLVYVALDQNGRPHPVPRLRYETPEEKKRAEQARARQEYRKRQSAQEAG